MNTNEWEYVNGNPQCDCSAQISPDGKTVLLKEYESTRFGVKRTFRMLDISQGGMVQEYCTSIPVFFKPDEDQEKL